jgi:hypothetical protein
MDALDVSALQVIGGVLTLAALFVLREFASGALKKAGEEFWLWMRRGHAGGNAAESHGHENPGTEIHTEVGGLRGEHVELGVADDGSPGLLPFGRDKTRAAATQQDSGRDDDLSDSHRKSA